MKTLCTLAALVVAYAEWGIPGVVGVVVVSFLLAMGD